jgi:hypothetical protein
MAGAASFHLHHDPTEQRGAGDDARHVEPYPVPAERFTRRLVASARTTVACQVA